MRTSPLLESLTPDELKRAGVLLSLNATTSRARIVHQICVKIEQLISKYYNMRVCLFTHFAKCGYMYVCTHRSNICED